MSDKALCGLRAAILLWTLALASPGMAASLAEIASAAQTTRPGVFGAHEQKVVDRGGVRRWQDLAGRVSGEVAVLRLCLTESRSCEAPGLGAWRAAVAGAFRQDRNAILRAVNRFFNAVSYRDDADAFGAAEYWATPTEFLRSGGDCEDYAIAKYASLRALGFDDSELRVVVVRDLDKQRNHAVLAVTVDGQELILDSATKMIYRDNAITIYHPLVSFNLTSIWVHFRTRPDQGRILKMALGQLD